MPAWDILEWLERSQDQSIVDPGALSCAIDAAKCDKTRMACQARWSQLLTRVKDIIDIVVETSDCRRNTAIDALRESGGDTVEAIIRITTL